MSNKNSSWFEIIGIFGLIFGILSCLSIIGIVVGIPTIIASNKFIKMSNMPESEIMNNKSSVITWSVVLCICCCPFGFLALIPALSIDGKWHDTPYVPQARTFEEIENEKLDKINKLKDLKDNGLISEEEFTKAKSKIFDKN